MYSVVQREEIEVLPSTLMMLQTIIGCRVQVDELCLQQFVT